MGKQPNIIELNGKRYDVRTGKILPARETVSQGGATFVKPVAAHSGTALDGFASKHRKPHTGPAAPNPAHHKVERSKTLMRTAVKKPTPQKASSKPKAINHHSSPRLDVDPVRISRASKIHKSHLVSRFGGPTGIKPVTAPLPVQDPPTMHEPPVFNAHDRTPLENKLGRGTFDKAIEKATSHHQPHAKKPNRRHRVARKLHVSPRVINAGAASLAVLLLVGFVAYQNIPNLSMRIATARAGVEGSLPGYQPAGFGMSGPIHYKPGQITISFKSHSDGRQFQVSQRASQWNSETLLESFVATNRRAYQTYQDSGKTIYIYDGDNATWVDGGVWYQIEGNSSLNSDQLLRLAASM